MQTLQTQYTEIYWMDYQQAFQLTDFCIHQEHRRYIKQKVKSQNWALWHTK